MPAENENKKTDDKAKQEFEKVPEKKKQPVAIPGASNVHQDVKVYLESIYDFRFNVIMQMVQYKLKTDNMWLYFGDREFNLIYSSLKLSGTKISKEGLKTILNGVMSKDFHPFRDYINNLPKWNEGDHDHITDFIDMVELDNEEDRARLRDNFKRWFVALVASLMDDHVINHQCFVLLGDQGRFKTTFLNSIVPEALKLDYLFSQPFNFENKDHIKFLGMKILIQLDELSSYNKTDITTLKTVLTQDRVITRFPYAAFDTHLWRCASFAGNANNDQFLTDETGNRRFLVHKVRSINFKPFDVALMYAEAFTLWKNGFKYWFDLDDIVKINEHNENYSIHSIEEELITEWLSIPTEDDIDYARVEYLSATRINTILAEKSPKINMNETTKSRIGRIMKKLGFSQISKRVAGFSYPVRVYAVLINSAPYIKSQDRVFDM